MLRTPSRRSTAAQRAEEKRFSLGCGWSSTKKCAISPTVFLLAGSKAGTRGTRRSIYRFNRLAGFKMTNPSDKFVSIIAAQGSVSTSALLKKLRGLQDFMTSVPQWPCRGPCARLLTSREPSNVTRNVWYGEGYKI